MGKNSKFKEKTQCLRGLPLSRCDDRIIYLSPVYFVLYGLLQHLLGNSFIVWIFPMFSSLTTNETISVNWKLENVIIFQQFQRISWGFIKSNITFHSKFGWVIKLIMHHIRKNRKCTFFKEASEIFTPNFGLFKSFFFWFQWRKPLPIKHFQNWLWYLTLNHYG